MSPRDRNKLVVGIPTLLILLGLIVGPATVRYIEAQTQPIVVNGAPPCLYGSPATIKACVDGSGNLTLTSIGGIALAGNTFLANGGVAGSLTVSNIGTLPGAISTGIGATALAVPRGAIGLATSSTSSVGNTGQGGRLVVVCGPTANTASLLFYAGTTNVPVVLANAVGGGLIGC